VSVRANSSTLTVSPFSDLALITDAWCGFAVSLNAWTNNAPGLQCTLVGSFLCGEVVFYLERTLLRLDHRFYRLTSLIARGYVIWSSALFIYSSSWLMMDAKLGRILANWSGTLAAWWVMSSVRSTMGLGHFLPGSFMG